VDAQRGTFRKLLLIYMVFGVVFLILPPLILYLLLVFFIWICKSTTVRK
jgi:hypothetical protein